MKLNKYENIDMTWIPEKLEEVFDADERVEIPLGEDSFFYLTQNDIWDDPLDFFGLKGALFSKKDNFRDDLDIKKKRFSDWSDVYDYITFEEGPSLILEVSIYDHSGCRIYVGSPSCPWDSYNLGFVWMTYEDIREWLKARGRKEKITKEVIREVKEYMISSVNYYSHWVSGDIYEFGVCLCGEYLDDLCVEITPDNLKEQKKFLLETLPEDLRREFYRIKKEEFEENNPKLPNLNECV